MRGKCINHGEVDGVKPKFNWIIFLILLFIVGFGIIYLIWYLVQNTNRCPICNSELQPIVYNRTQSIILDLFFFFPIKCVYPIIQNNHQSSSPILLQSRNLFNLSTSRRYSHQEADTFVFHCSHTFISKSDPASKFSLQNNPIFYRFA